MHGSSSIKCISEIKISMFTQSPSKEQIADRDRKLIHQLYQRLNIKKEIIHCKSPNKNNPTLFEPSSHLMPKKHSAKMMLTKKYRPKEDKLEVKRSVIQKPTFLNAGHVFVYQQKDSPFSRENSMKESQRSRKRSLTIRKKDKEKVIGTFEPLLMITCKNPIDRKNEPNPLALSQFKAEKGCMSEKKKDKGKKRIQSAFIASREKRANFSSVEVQRVDGWKNEQEGASFEFFGLRNAKTQQNFLFDLEGLDDDTL